MNISCIQELRRRADPRKAALFPRFFKTGKGEYGEGDTFLGVTVPSVRSVAKKYAHLPLPDIRALLRNPYHEVRLLALFILVFQYESAVEDTVKKKLVDLYIDSRQFINNWDLVDTSAYKILGDYLRTHDRKILDRFAQTNHLWTQRIAIVATYAFIRVHQFEDTFRVAKLFLRHPHDLIHKATGWMLREVGKRDLSALRKFLNTYATAMPRTMLRYAIEKLPLKERSFYLSLRKKPHI